MTNEAKIVITTEDLPEGESPPTGLSPRTVFKLPLWWRILHAALILFPPVLFIIILAGLFKTRRENVSKRHAYEFQYCCFLLASGILWAFLLLALTAWTPRNLIEQVTTQSSLSILNFPDLPSTNTLTGMEIAKNMSPLVVSVHMAESSMFPPYKGVRQPFGAGAITYANQSGCLIVTSRHVVDALLSSAQLGRKVGVALQDGQYAEALVVGLHRDLDIALLWVSRGEGQGIYVQPLRKPGTIEIGEQIYVIGHPEGLEFSLSGGLVAQTRGEDLIQLSAPVSPGNSGGPVYDVNGRLLAIIQSVIDKTKSPNAENLNFAVRIDDLFSLDAWIVNDEGRAGILALATVNSNID